MCKMLLPCGNENMDGRRKIPYLWANIALVSFAAARAGVT